MPADVSAEAPADGAPTTLTTTAPGQNAKVTVTLGASERALLTCRVASSSRTSPQVDTTLVGPAGNKIYLDHGCDTGSEQTLRRADAWGGWQPGSYTLELDPDDDVTASFVVRAYRVPVDATAEAVLDGPAN